MGTLSSSFPEYSSSTNHVHSRNHKSLGLLCSNFLSLYDREDVQLIDLDDAASRLGAERRRIYDIANILEGVGARKLAVLERKAENQYDWKGFEAIPAALQQLKEEGLKENFTAHQKDFTCEVDRHGSGKECPQGSKQFDFGPFAPAIVAEVGPDSCKDKENHDWASLASTYRPQSQNQAVRELFYHYVEAWTSWYSEAVKNR